MTSISRIPVLFASLALAACLVGCWGEQAKPRPLGASLRQAVASQTLDPGAGGDLPVESMDGRAAQGVVASYRDGFGAKQQSGVDMNKVLKSMGGK